LYFRKAEVCLEQAGVSFHGISIQSVGAELVKRFLKIPRTYTAVFPVNKFFFQGRTHSVISFVLKGFFIVSLKSLFPKSLELPI